ncbi:MAG TPA: GDP-L-fucose synthase [Candidatus Paceibacterota bacterium]|nr:GDP-L-fucose synthase [Candidatus Paceibacterota bacterium]
MDKNAKIYVAGHAGLAGSAVVRALQAKGYTNLVLRTHQELDLLDESATKAFFESEKPEYVIQCAARVGGIIANSTYPADFLIENLKIQNNVIWNAHLLGVKKLVFVSSAAIYPQEAPQPVKEEYLLSGPFAPAHEAYAVAKIAGMTLCKKLSTQYGKTFISVVPTNLYGPNDRFDKEQGHVVPGLLQRMHEAKQSGDPTFTVWGTGNARREFLYADDFADAILFLFETYDKPEFLNVGVGEDISIRELAEKVQSVVGYTGELVYDTSKPEGPQRRLLDSGRLHQLGWKHSTPLDEGLEKAYEWFVAHKTQHVT